MTGFLLLTEYRSGSNWVCSMTNRTQKMGKAEEWLLPSRQKKIHTSSPDEHAEIILTKSSTSNGVFAAKIFPNQLIYTNKKFGYDFIRKMFEEREASVFVLLRRDQVGQAISAHRAMQSGSWTAEKAQRRELHYNFNSICRQYFRIVESEMFWRSYLSLTGIPHQLFVYEDLLPDPSPYLRAVAGQLSLDVPVATESRITVQRDDLTEQWRTRFTEDARRLDVLNGYAARDVAHRNLGNLLRLLRKQPLIQNMYAAK